MSTKFDTDIKRRLELRRGDWLEIAKKAGVSHSWISKFVNGHIANPGYATLVKLAAALPPQRRAQAATEKEGA